MQTWDIQEIGDRIRKMRTLAEEVKEKGKGLKAVERNVERILASISILELDIGGAPDWLDPRCPSERV